MRSGSGERNYSDPGFARPLIPERLKLRKPTLFMGGLSRPSVYKCGVQDSAKTIVRSRRVFLFALAWATFVVVVVHFVDFPGSVPNFRDSSRGGILLDASPAFTPDGIYQRLAEYGAEGRQNYSFRNVTVDTLLPLSVLPFLFLLALRASTAFAHRRVLFGLVISLPFIYVIFDFLENATVLRLLASYPNRLDELAASLPYTTMIKRAGSLLAIAVPLGLLGVRFVTRKVHV
jgi:hypothetical protein